MAKKKFIAASLIALSHQGASAQSTDPTAPFKVTQATGVAVQQDEATENSPPASEVPPPIAVPSGRVGDSEFRRLHDQWKRLTPDEATARIKSGQLRQKSAADLPDCYPLRDISPPLPEGANWAWYFSGTGDLRISAFIDTMSIRHCRQDDELQASFWTKSQGYGRNDVFYVLNISYYSCSNRKPIGADRSLVYLKDGTVTEFSSNPIFEIPIPGTIAYNAVKYICSFDDDVHISNVPNYNKIWEDINVKIVKESWSILVSDITKEFTPNNNIVKFWVKKKYRNSNIYKYKQFYSFDGIDCRHKTYLLGQAYGVPDLSDGYNYASKIGIPSYGKSIQKIAPGSIQEAVMKRVCKDQ